MRPESFSSKTVVITGAGGGIGSALARRFAAAGARLGLLDLKAPRALEQELGAGAVAVDCDVTDPAACQVAARRVEAALGRVDVLVNNAGITHRSPFGATDVDVLRRVMEVNYFGAVHMTHACLDSLRRHRRGQVIAISSVAGFAPLTGRVGYAASKHALEGMMATLPGELAGEVDVLVVRPSFIDTKLATSALDAHGAIARHNRSSVGRPMSSEAAAKQIVEAAARRKRALVLSPVGKVSWWLTRLTPRVYEAAMRRTQRRELEAS